MKFERLIGLFVRQHLLLNAVVHTYAIMCIRYYSAINQQFTPPQHITFRCNPANYTQHIFSFCADAINRVSTALCAIVHALRCTDGACTVSTKVDNIKSNIFN